MKLIIAEKPSLAKAVKSAIIDEFTSQDGYFQGNEYIVSFAFGHLFGLLDIDEYLKKPPKSPWTMNDLPFIPNHFQFGLKKKDGVVDPGIKKQFTILCDLINRDDVTEIIHCGDADREGEVIVRLIILNGLKDKNKAIRRLWLPDQTEETIRAGLTNSKDDSEYDQLYKEGLARTYEDWLYGINLTRYVTIKAGELLRVGRVVGAIVQIIYDKELQIRNFVPTKFYKLESKESTKNETITLSLDETYTLDQEAAALKRCSFLNSKTATVKDIKKERKVRAAGKLFSLSKLQGYVGKKLKLSPSETLEAVQKLYEVGYVTYPRTNTEYLAEGEKDKVKDIIKALGDDYKITFKDGKSIFDNSKIESHSALTPTTKIPKDLTGTVAQVYEIIRNRFLAVFCSEKCEVDQSTMVIQIDDIEFIIKGTVLVARGYLQYEEDSKRDKLLPALNIGDMANINFVPVEKETSPPKRYTIETLNNHCKNPFKKEMEISEEDEYKMMFDGVEIGTEATRAGIIDNAINNGYISLEGLGEYLIQALTLLDIDMSKEQSVKLSKTLKQVYRGELKVSEAVNVAKQEIEKSFIKKDITLPEIPEEFSQRKSRIIGKCPKCGNNIFENKATFSCAGYKEGCKFVIFKNDKYFESLGVKVTATMAQQLLLKNKIKGKFKSQKSGKEFTATVTVNYSGEYPKYEMKFAKGGKKEKKQVTSDN